MKADKVTELPVGKYDAVRTLRHALQQAENGEFDTVIIICANGIKEDTGKGFDIWASWSDMTRQQVLWKQRWFNSWLNFRYFGFNHVDDEEG